MTDWTLGLIRGGRRLLALSALGAGLSALAQPADDTVVYPRNAAPGPAVAGRAAPAGGSAWLLVGAAGVGVAGWWFWRQRQQAAQGNPAARKLAIAESRPLGNRQYLVVAEYDGRKYLLGVCPGHIEMLAPLDGSAPAAPKP